METSMINVQKRDTSVEPLNLDKVHTMVEEACKDLSGVSASQVEMNSGIQFEDGITTEQIQEILIRSASDLITLENPNYQFVAARLLLFGLRKQVFNKNVWKEGMPNVFDVALYNATINKVYDEDILDKYSDEDWNKVNTWIDHDRDYLFTYAGLRQVTDKYLVNEVNAEQTRIQQEQLDLLQLAMNKLTPEKKEVLVLSKYQGMRYQDIAEVLEITESAVKVRIFRALKDLKKAYESLELQPKSKTQNI